MIKCSCDLNKDSVALLFAAMLVLNIPGCIGSAMEASKAFYEQVILKRPYGIRLHIPTNYLQPVDCSNDSRSYCWLHKASSPRLPQTVSV